jgi:hypothetical protein
MNDLKSRSSGFCPIPAAELRKLPPDERAAILESQAARAEDLYRLDPRLTDFEAFGEDDVHADEPVSEEG